MTGYDDELAQLRRQVRELSDRVEVAELPQRLYRWLDEGVGDPRFLFTEDVRADTPGGQVEGIERVVALATRDLTPDKGQQHLVTNVLVELDGDHATVHANMLLTIAPSAAPAGAFAPGVTAQVGGRSRFEATRTAEGWRLSLLDHRPMWLSGSLGGAS